MDQFFNQATAREILERIIIDRVEQGPKYVQLITYQQAEGAGAIAKPVYIDRPRAWKLSMPVDIDGTPEELVLRIQGIVCKTNLPPIKKPMRIEPKQRRYFRQSVTLTAFGSASFQACNDSIMDIHHTFSRLLPPNSMEDWVPTQFEDHVAIDMGNRYFTDRHDQAYHEVVQFNKNVDPDGILQDAMATDFVHLDENNVVYFELTDDDTNKYKVIDPIRIRAGDIVEAQISFVTVPLKGNKYKLLIVLRALTILDIQPLKDAELTWVKHKFAKQQPPPQIRLKR